jgi:acyl-CoA reductase-like NAD-dependent aldehyde dehydrogenase
MAKKTPFEYAPAPESRSIVDIKPSYGLFVGGEFVDGHGRSFKTISPSTEEVLADIAEADEADIDLAVRAARRAHTRVWGRMPGRERAKYLYRIARIIQERGRELAVLESIDNGKPIKETRDVDVPIAAAHFFYYAGWADKLEYAGYGTQSLGVAGQVIPWNFPLLMLAWKIAPALACGNTVVFKPAELAPASPWALTDIVQRAGLPPGVLNLVMGPGARIGAALAASPDVDAVTFTGSQDVGPSVAAAAVAHGARIQLEMGGKNPLVVLDDADLDTAVDCAVKGAFFQTGQRCTASSRLIVTDEIHDRFVAAVQAQMAKLKIGHALEAGTDIGPVVDQRQLDRDLRYLDIGRREGARLTGGEILERATPGFYLAPALLTETNNRMKINRDEIFGPVAAVIRVRNYDEALAVANDTDFGLSAGICTTSLKHARHFQAHALAGLVMINLPTAGLDYHVPFGGRKASSYGPREQGRYAAEFYTTVKTTYISA